MKKMDIVQEGMKISKVEFDIYCKLFGEKLIKLNLTSCEKSKISILMPFEQIILINIIEVVDIIMISVIQQLLMMGQI